MTRRKPVTQTVAEAIQDKIEALGLELVDIELVTENKAKFLRIYIDKAGGISTDDCTAVSRMVDPIIDNELKINIHDYLEVSSPGLERPLKTERDYERYQGEWVLVKLYKALDGKKQYNGTLGPVTADTITIVDDNGQAHCFLREQVARTRRAIRS